MSPRKHSKTNYNNITWAAVYCNLFLSTKSVLKLKGEFLVVDIHVLEADTF